MKPLNAVPLSAIEKIDVYEPEVDFNHAKACRAKLYRFEIILKEDFLHLYLDPYYELTFN